MAECCGRWKRRLYYIIISAVIALILFIQLVSLGTFGVQFSRTSSSWQERVNSEDSVVCVLYGTETEDNLANVALPTSASACGFVLWGNVTVILMLLVWLIIQVVMAIVGRPRVVCLFRISDLIVMALLGLLSLTISSVLTDGLARTCDAIPDESSQTTSCSEKSIIPSRNPENDIPFYGNLNAAKDTSWTVTILFISLALWNVVLLFMSCCVRRFNKSKEDKEDGKTKKIKQDNEDDKNSEELSKFDE